MKTKGGVQNKPTLREQIEEVLRAWQAQYVYPDGAEENILDIIREHDKRVIGEDNYCPSCDNNPDEFPGDENCNYKVNLLRAEQRERSELETK